MVKINRILTTAVLILAASQSYAQKACPPGLRDIDAVCNCDDVDADALYDSARSCRVIWLSSTSSSIPENVSVRPSGNNRAWILLEPMTYEIGSTGLIITIPAGFVTDYASIPSRLWSVYSPHDQYSRAAMVHDYLYWSQLCTREQADNLFMIAMKESEVAWATRNFVYWGVRGGGEESWETNNRERAKNRPKVVPLDRKDFPPNWTWERYRDLLVTMGVKDPIFAGNDYCILGDSTDIPTIAPNSTALAQPKLVERPSPRPGRGPNRFLPR